MVYRVRTFREADRAAKLALWERVGVSRPWLDLAAEITANGAGTARFSSWRVPRTGSSAR